MHESLESDHGRLLDSIESFLQQMVTDVVPIESPGRGRPRILPALCLWAGLLVCVLRGQTSQLALWRLLTQTGLWLYPRYEVSDQAVYKRLATGGLEPLQRLFAAITTLLTERLESFALRTLAPFARDVVALDETTLDQVVRSLPSLRQVPEGDVRLLPGKLAALFDVRRQLWRRLVFVPDAQQNEKVLARELVQTLSPGALILCDLGYFGYAWFDWLTDRGYYYISRFRQKTSFVCQHVFYQQGDLFDGIVFLGAYRADRAAHAVRLVQFRVGQHVYRYITNVLDPTVLPIAQLAAAYARRWDIELAIKLIKRHLNLHLLWSAKPVVVQQQVWAVLIISQVLQALRMEIAGRADADPYEVSMQLMIAYLPQLAREGRDPITTFLEIGRTARFIRPSTRTAIEAPDIPPEAMAPVPESLTLWRQPRYAQRRCHRPGKEAN